MSAGQIAVVTDSTSDLPLDNPRGIRVVPLHLHFGDEQYEDGATMTREAFWARMASNAAGPNPSTSQPAAAAFRDAYAELAEAGAGGIVSVHISGKLSGTLNSARQGAALLEGAVEVRAVDSLTTSWGLGWSALAAAEAAEAGATLDQAASAAADTAGRTRLMLFVETLDHLLRGGRIGRARHLAGRLLRMRPLLELIDGEVADIERPRTRAKAVERLYGQIMASSPERVSIMHGDCEPEARELAERVRDAGVPSVEVAFGSTILGAHVGPGSLGAALLRERA